MLACEQAHWEKGEPARNHAFYSIIPLMTMKERLGASLYRRYRMSNDNCECKYAILFLLNKTSIVQEVNNVQ